MSMLLAIIFGVVALISVGLSVWQFVVAWRFPLQRRVAETGFAPGVTILKPLKGCDEQTRACLESWLTQSYAGPVQILFGVASGDDPVCGLVEQLLSEFPQADARLVKCPQMLGPNAKVSTLMQLYSQVRYDLVVISDADVWVPSDLLGQVLGPLRDPEVGLVHCFYRFANACNFAMRCEAVAVNADFWSQVLQAASLKPLQFALGAVMAVRRADLDQAGGFAGLVEYLADDYQLGRRVAAMGKRIVTSPIVVECRERPADWMAVLHHQIRWARTIRVCQPVPYFFSILSNITVWTLAWLFFYPATWALVLGSGMLLWRTLSAQLLENRFTGRPPGGLDTWVVLLKDFLGAGVWAAAFLGDEVQWRGQIFRVRRGGRLQTR